MKGKRDDEEEGNIDQERKQLAFRIGRLLQLSHGCVLRRRPQRNPEEINRQGTMESEQFLSRGRGEKRAIRQLPSGMSIALCNYSVTLARIISSVPTRQ